MKDLRLENVEKFRKIVRYLNYAESTKKTYISYVTKFVFEIDVRPSHIKGKTIKNYLLNFNYSSVSQQNQIISALRLYGEKVLGLKDLKKIVVARPRNQKKLPQVVSKKLMLDNISKIKNLKHKAILSLAYSTGMRISEVRNLKIEHIDSDRMLILIENSKFNKDRYVKLSPYILKMLREYFRRYRPKDYLFNGDASLQYSISSLGNISKKYLGVTFHKVRHSCFTALVENGTQMRIIQKMAGHSSSKTTEIYTHVSNDILQNVKTPL